ncbi:MAG: outer membrane protein assembly factor BamB family protein, partial [Planctomycetota bacterium]
MPRIPWFLALTAALVLGSAEGRGGEGPAFAAGVRGGLCVHLGVTDGELTAELSCGGKFVVHGLAAEAASVEKARAQIASKGLYGRVSVERSDMKRLPYAENLVNVIVAEDLGALMDKGLTGRELFRVIAPLGAVCFKKGDAAKLKAAGFGEVKSTGGWSTAAKPWPEEMDQWTHWRYAAHGNMVSRDKLAGLPHRVQWTSDPDWIGHGSKPKTMVSANGRVFHLYNSRSIVNKEPGIAPVREALVARDAFNGLLLWEKEVKQLKSAKAYTRSKGYFSDRALVAAGDRLYVNMDPENPLVALDAATGEVVKTYKEAGAAKILLHEKGSLLLGGGGGVSCVDAESGKVRWKVAAGPTAMAVGDGKVFALQEARGGAQLLCLDMASGRELWKYSDKMSRKQDMFYAAGGVFLLERRGKFIRHISAKGGKLVAKLPGPRAEGGDMDVFYIGDQLWKWKTGRSGWQKMDPVSGDIRKELDYSGMKRKSRCHPFKATGRYILAEDAHYFDIVAGKHIAAPPVARGTCYFGVIPANGMVYWPPDGCNCFARIRGVVATSSVPVNIKGLGSGGKLERGPASGSGGGGGGGWTTFRGDAKRSACTAAAGPSGLKQLWETKVGAEPGAPTAAGGAVYVASKAEHTVSALDAVSGKLR